VDWSERLSATRAGRLRTWAGELHGALARARLSAAAARPHPASEGDGLLVVGGTGLGGSGKTPVVEWLARRLTAAGVAVAIVGHGFRAGDARWVRSRRTATRPSNSFAHCPRYPSGSGDPGRRRFERPAPRFPGASS
jgi:hypothetical protein